MALPATRRAAVSTARGGAGPAARGAGERESWRGREGAERGGGLPLGPAALSPQAAKHWGRGASGLERASPRGKGGALSALFGREAPPCFWGYGRGARSVGGGGKEEEAEAGLRGCAVPSSPRALRCPWPPAPPPQSEGRVRRRKGENGSSLTGRCGKGIRTSVPR